MLPLQFKSDQGLKVLCLGAHCDDIEIGCGGSLLKLFRDYSDCICHWIVFTATTDRAQEARSSADYFLENCSSREVSVLDFPDTLLPQYVQDIKIYFEGIKSEFEPDIIFTHYRDDRHQDHRVISDITWNTFRNHLILEYEIPKYDGDLGQPNFFTHLDGDLAIQKVNGILEYFKSQKNKHWFEADTFLSLMRIRGLECANQEKYAEAFYARKLSI